ncbi:MAG: ABC transporter permease [Phycisphaerales bacterium]|nr:ABC transporter permease [Phycisphaerales bacterium]
MLRIALRMLIGDMTKSAGVVMGVFLCTFLITHLLSMFAGMMQRSYALVSDIPDADIWVMDPAVEYVDEPAPLTATALDRVKSVDGVAWASPLYTGSLRTRLPSGAFRSALVIGIDDATLFGAPAHLTQGDVLALRSADAVIADAAGAETFLRMPVSPPVRLPGWHLPDLTAPTRPLELGDELLVNDRRVVVVGIADLGIRFLAKPILYTTYSRARSLAPRERNLLSFVLVKLSPGADPAAVTRRIQDATGLRARTRGEFQQDTYDYYVKSTGVVARIAFMVGIGAAVGVTVSALLLYMFTMENLQHYGTLMALGTSHSTLLRMIAVQAAASAAAGYGLGVGGSCLMGALVKSSAMPFLPTFWNMGTTAATVTFVAVVAAVLSGMRILRLEPAIVFRR